MRIGKGIALLALVLMTVVAVGGCGAVEENLEPKGTVNVAANDAKKPAETLMWKLFQECGRQGNVDSTYEAFSEDARQTKNLREDVEKLEEFLSDATSYECGGAAEHGWNADMEMILFVRFESESGPKRMKIRATLPRNGDAPEIESIEASPDDGSSFSNDPYAPGEKFVGIRISPNAVRKM